MLVFALKVYLPEHFVFLLPTARGLFLAPHLLSLLAASSSFLCHRLNNRSFPWLLPNARSTISWLQLADIPPSTRLAVWPEVRVEELLVPVAQLVSHTAARGLSFETDLPCRVWASDAASPYSDGVKAVEDDQQLHKLYLTDIQPHIWMCLSGIMLLMYLFSLVYSSFLSMMCSWALQKRSVIFLRHFWEQ